MICALLYVAGLLEEVAVSLAVGFLGDMVKERHKGGRIKR